MELPISERSAEVVKSMIECLDAVEHLEHCGYHTEALTHETSIYKFAQFSGCAFVYSSNLKYTYL